MADNYLLFSATIPNITKKQKHWAQRELDTFEDDESVGYDFEYTFEHDGKTIEMYIYSQESANLEHVVDFVKKFLTRFKRKDVFILQWAETCSKPRPGEFGGGAVIVTADSEKWLSTRDWVNKELKKMEKAK